MREREAACAGMMGSALPTQGMTHLQPSGGCAGGASGRGSRWWGAATGVPSDVGPTATSPSLASGAELLDGSSREQRRVAEALARALATGAAAAARRTRT